MHSMTELTQKQCAYQITGPVQQLEFDVDIETLRREIFDFIINGNFEYQTVSLRLPEGNTDYTSNFEYLESDGTQAFVFRDEYELDPTIHNRRQIPEIKISQEKYTHWHPMLKDSYLASLIPELETLSGFKIGKVRLGWLSADSGYPMHYDLEPLRLHIPIFTNANAYIIHDNEFYNMKYGKLYHLITTKIHTAWNFGTLPRLHLIFSTYSDNEFALAINELTKINTKKQNLSNQFLNSGVDNYSIEQLNNINNTGGVILNHDAHNTIRTVQDLLNH
jgi:hypothetical protein